MSKRTIIRIALATVIAFIGFYGYGALRAQRHWAFHEACAQGDVVRASLLLRFGADPAGIKDSRYYVNYAWNVFEHSPPIIVAAHGNHAPIIELLIRTGANPNMQSKEGLTPLEIIRLNGDIATAEALEMAIK